EQAEALKMEMSDKPSLATALSLQRILFFPEQTRREEILKTLVQTLPIADRVATLRSIEEREKAGGIMIRPDVAIPHTTVPNLHGVLAALGIQRSQEESQKGRRYWLLFV